MTISAPCALTDDLPLRRIPEYRRWLAGDLLQDAGAGIALFAFPLVTLAVTGSVGAVGLVGMIQGIGTLIGMIPGGLLADRFDRRRIRMLASVIGAILQLALIAFLLTGTATVDVLAALAFLYSCTPSAERCSARPRTRCSSRSCRPACCPEPSP